MKGQNKSTQLALGALVVLIWALVAYRFRNLAQGQNETVTGQSFTMPETLTLPPQEALQLNLGYPDPFLSTYAAPRKSEMVGNAGTKAPAATPTSNEPKASSATPTGISYKGFSKDDKGNIRARVTVNGKGVTLKAGDSFGKLEILSVTQAAVNIKWEGKEYTIQRYNRK